uniref:Proteasome activator subunit 2 n=1 Tax=Sparus aurata TaxID=8175 RepID=A0A671YD76_SPAAU
NLTFSINKMLSSFIDEEQLYCKKCVTFLRRINKKTLIIKNLLKWFHKVSPKCGFIKGNEKILALLQRVKPEICAFRETIITVTGWIQHLIPKIEDGNDFGVAIQEKILERIGAVKTKADTFQTNINKYFTERGDAVAKASKDTHVMDYRALVHEKDEAIYSEIRVIVLDIRGFYAELYDIISKNEDKVTNPKGEEKPSMY